MRNLLILLFIWLINFSGTRPGPEEGMYPLSELKKLDFKKTGLKLSATDLFNPDGVSLLDALVRLGGCTGSFVSKEGLIVSNHHCVYGSVAEVSTVEKDYLKNGFHAKMKAEELKTKLTLKITANYEDISAKILEKVKDITNPSIRVDSIRAAMKAMEKEASAKDTSSLYEVSEMFPGKSYVLFKYKTIRDIRLVYVPPITIGNFGGESDNWVWPRHTGDFAFVRAYVGPDGNPAEYSEKNIPYTPANFLKIATKGSEENDAVFILGYPGRTYRHFPSAYLEYQEKFVLPYISKLYDWLIEGMELEGKDHPKRALEYANRIKSLANVTKNFKGKIQGIDRTGLIETKRLEEKKLLEVLNADAGMKQQYSAVLPKMKEIYSNAKMFAPKELWLDQSINQSWYFYAGNLIQIHREKALKLNDSERKKYWTDHSDKIIGALKSKSNPSNIAFEKRVLEKFLIEASTLNKEISLDPINRLTGEKDKENAIRNFISKSISKSIFSQEERLYNLISENPEKLMSLKDPMISLAADLYPEHLANTTRKKEREGELNIYLPQLLEMKMKILGAGFLPDANATMRFTYGKIKGYSPSDGVYHAPFTTMKGIFEKGSASGDYELFPSMKEMYQSGGMGNHRSASLKDVPVDVLYNLDTTGGNSGSPLLNDKGELIGVNFDRAFTATINDYAWNESYSRSIAVDIRYVLWVLENIGPADNVIRELGMIRN